MVLAVNLLALLLVVGLCWLAMVWVTGRFHHTDHEDVHIVALPVDEGDFEPGDPCMVCEGVGAKRSAGRLAPCEVCRGTGVFG